MNIKMLSVVICVMAVVWATQAKAITDDQYNRIKRLGELNGVALHCSFLDEARRLKGALVIALPKRRQLGQAFEDVTNESFLAFIRSNSSCPDEALFSRQVDEAIDALNAAFSTE